MKRSHSPWWNKNDVNEWNATSSIPTLHNRTQHFWFRLLKRKTFSSVFLCWEEREFVNGWTNRRNLEILNRLLLSFSLQLLHRWVFLPLKAFLFRFCAVFSVFSASFQHVLLLLIVHRISHVMTCLWELERFLSLQQLHSLRSCLLSWCSCSLLIPSFLLFQNKLDFTRFSSPQIILSSTRFCCCSTLQSLLNSALVYDTYVDESVVSVVQRCTAKLIWTPKSPIQKIAQTMQHLLVLEWLCRGKSS